MAWTFEGTGGELGVSLSENGIWSAYGNASQHCRPHGGDVQIFRYVDSIAGVWSLHSSNAEEHEYDGAGRGLKAVFVRNGGKACATIQYYEKDAQYAPVVGLDVLMNPQMAVEAINLFRSIIGRSDIRYVISVGFSGFPNRGSAGQRDPERRRIHR